MRPRNKLAETARREAYLGVSRREKPPHTTGMLYSRWKSRDTKLRRNSADNGKIGALVRTSAESRATVVYTYYEIPSGWYPRYCVYRSCALITLIGGLSLRCRAIARRLVSSRTTIHRAVSSLGLISIREPKATGSKRFRASLLRVQFGSSERNKCETRVYTRDDDDVALLRSTRVSRVFVRFAINRINCSLSIKASAVDRKIEFSRWIRSK